jgi:hypothetical protein
MAGRVAGWLLDPEDRGRLLALFPPAYREVVAHHLTLKPGVARGFPLPREREGFVAGVADTLEEQGLASFASWDELAASVAARLEAAGASVMPAGAVAPAGGDGGPAAGAPRASAGAARG